jgi:hypothetical protein
VAPLRSQSTICEALIHVFGDQKRHKQKIKQYMIEAFSDLEKKLNQNI